MASEVSKAKVEVAQQAQKEPRRQGKGSSRGGGGSSGPFSGRVGAEAEAEAAAGEVMPEWKLKCLCVEVGVPRITSGSLNMGGCF